MLFGDILGISWHDLGVIGALLVGALVYLVLSLRAQVLLTLNSNLAGSMGVRNGWHQLVFIALLAVVVAVSIKAVGVLLISAFVVIPACTGCLLSRSFPLYVLNSALLGGSCALVGLPASGLTNLPSGPSVVMVQFLGFLAALIWSGLGLNRPATSGPAALQTPDAAPVDRG